MALTNSYVIPKYEIYHSSATVALHKRLLVFIQNCFVKTVEGYLSLYSRL